MPTSIAAIISFASAGSLCLVAYYAQEPIALWHPVVVFAVSFVFLKV